jgi:allophanate hydrolase subunit 1
VPLFDPNTNPPTVINAGDYVRFVQIDSEEEYMEIDRQAKAGEYKVSMETKQ